MTSPITGPERVAFAGLGAMGFGMTCNLLKTSSYSIKGYDVFAPSEQKFIDCGGDIGDSPRDAAEDSGFLICMATNSQQIDKILFDKKDGALQSLPLGATILICSTVSPVFYEILSSRISQAGRHDVLIVDCPVSGGTKRAADGTLTTFASGTSKALDRANDLLCGMFNKLHIIPGGAGAGSKAKMVNQRLVGTHIAASAEAMALAAKAGLNTREVYNIIANAAGNSWAFENRVPHMLDGDWTPHSVLDIFVKDMNIVVSTARKLQFPVPLASVVEQLYISSSSQGFGREDDAGIVRIFLPGTPNAVMESAKNADDREPITQSATTPEISKIGMIGLGAMGQGMAASLLRAGYEVHGYDVYPPAVEKFLSSGGRATGAKSPVDAVKGAEVEDILFGVGNAIEAISDGTTVILSSTVPPAFIKDLERRLSGLERGINLIDAPVSGGVVRAANGSLTMMCSGKESGLSQVGGPLMLMAGVPSNLHRIQGGVGAASSVKVINQLLAGVHIAAAAEAMAFASRLGLDPKSIFEILKNAIAWIWMFENRVPQMVNGDWTAHSALSIFVKDLGIVLDEAKRLMSFAPISAAAHTLYLSGAAHGLSKDSDAAVVRVWDMVAGISVSKVAGKVETPPSTNQKLYDTTVVADEPEPEPLPAQKTFELLPPEYALEVVGSIREYLSSDEAPVLVVLDDDPTRTQTCHDVDVLMAWDDASLDHEFSLEPKGFFILTNSRALPATEARVLIAEICKNVKRAAEKAGKAIEIVLRGDSTLRGHLPEEPEAAEEVPGDFDGWVLAPFFFQGGRYTINDVHYVKEDDVLVPASRTPFAQDATFGYKNSNLRNYSITLDDIRLGGPAAVTDKLLSIPQAVKKVVIVNAAVESDMFVFVAGLLEAGKKGRRYLYRTGAAFVSCRLGITEIPPLKLQDLATSTTINNVQSGGLIIAGSYVPKTTAQLKFLRETLRDKLEVIELDVAKLIISSATAEEAILDIVSRVSEYLALGHDVLVMTSRTLIKGQDGISSLKIGSKVAQAPVQLVQLVEVRPRYLIAKGGITWSDAATKGLKMKRAKILGQAAPGVPLWMCEEETSRVPGLPYVVFPGTVGSNSTLAEVVTAWAI
ncbi:Fc.00g103910.m01.CDS01 [Cosmosporella sp. VM-42]